MTSVQDIFETKVRLSVALYICICRRPRNRSETVLKILLRHVRSENFLFALLYFDARAKGSHVKVSRKHLRKEFLCFMRQRQ